MNSLLTAILTNFKEMGIKLQMTESYYLLLNFYRGLWYCTATSAFGCIVYTVGKGETKEEALSEAIKCKSLRAA